MPHVVTTSWSITGEQKFVLAAKGEPVTGVNAPVPASKVNTEIPPVRFAANKRLPLTASALGPVAGAVGTGVPAADRAPVSRLMVKTEIVLSPWLATNTSLPSASVIIAMGDAPTGIGGTGPVVAEPALDSVCAVSTPVSVLSVNCE